MTFQACECLSAIAQVLEAGEELPTHLARMRAVPLPPKVASHEQLRGLRGSLRHLPSTVGT